MEAYIKKHWNGEFPLWKSYWVNSVILSTIAGLIAGGIVGLMVGLTCASMGVPAPSKHTWDWLGVLIAAPILVWSIGGTWRSADTYNIEHTGGITWASMAKFGMCMGILQTVVQFVVAITAK